MKNATLVTAALLSFATLAGATNSNRDRQAPSGDVVRGIHGERLGLRTNMDWTLGGNFSNPFSAPRTASIKHVNIAEIVINDPGTGWEERFLVGVPTLRLNPAPVLVLFHEYGGTPEKMLDKTTYFQNAMKRGWIVVAPLSAHQYNFGIDYSQVNTKVALDWVIANLDVDPDRFYGIGFSMGGGTATSYASRHLDPDSARFAAIVNHTGSTSLRDSYWSANDKHLFESPLMFGGAPEIDEFRYQIASTIDLDTFTGNIDPDSDLARNLSHLELKSFNAEGDPLWYLITQTALLHDQVVGHGGSAVYTQSQDATHKWYTLDENEVLDYFDPIRYSDPDPGVLTRTLADSNGRWFHFEIEQNNKGMFSPFRWTVIPSLNRVVVDEAANMKRFCFDPVSAGLETADPIEFMYDSAESRPLEIVVYGCSEPPSDVLLNGNSTGNWSYDAATEAVTLYEDTTGNYPKWTIKP